MVSQTTIERNATGGVAGGSADGGRPDDGALEVEAVADATASGSVPAESPTAATAARHPLDRLHRLVLEARVATLEAQLARKERQLDEVVARYEEVLADRPGTGGDLAVTWPRRR